MGPHTSFIPWMYELPGFNLANMNNILSTISQWASFPSGKYEYSWLSSRLTGSGLKLVKPKRFLLTSSAFNWIVAIRLRKLSYWKLLEAFCISSHGNSVAFWKKNKSGHRRRTSLSIWTRTWLSLKNELHSLFAFEFSGF